MDAYVAEESSTPSHTTIIFTLREEPGALAETLKIFKVSF
jgi:prephenate dehydratase